MCRYDPSIDKPQQRNEAVGKLGSYNVVPTISQSGLGGLSTLNHVKY